MNKHDTIWQSQKSINRFFTQLQNNDDISTKQLEAMRNSLLHAAQLLDGKQSPITRHLNNALHALADITPSKDQPDVYKNLITLGYQCVFEPLYRNQTVKSSYFDQHSARFFQFTQSLPWTKQPLMTTIGTALIVIGLTVLTPAALLATQTFFIGCTSTASYSGLAFLMSLGYLAVSAVSAAVGYTGYKILNSDKVFEHKWAARTFAREIKACRELHESSIQTDKHRALLEASIATTVDLDDGNNPKKV